MTLTVYKNMEASAEAADQNGRDATAAITASAVHDAAGGGVIKEKIKEHIVEE